MATGFHFSQETPPDSMFTDVQSLNKFDNEQFEQISVIAYNFLIEPNKSSRLLNQLDEFAEQQGVKATALRNISKTLISIPNSALKKNLGAAQLKDDMMKLGLSEDKAASFTEKYRANLVALSRSALGQTLMVNQLVDMEWKFGVTAASSEVNKVGNTFIQLKLVINKGNSTENVYMELTLPQFYSFLHEMEKAKASLDFLS